MFDLEAHVLKWRQELARALGERRETLDELENHLREEYQRLLLAGRTAEEAWADAVARLGAPAALADEFAKLPAARPLRWTPAWVAVAGYVLILAGLVLPGLSPLRGDTSDG